MPELSGAGGFWRAIDEKPDLNVVRQQDNFSCGPACGEMLLKDRGIDRIKQSAIARETGTPVDVRVLAQVLNLPKCRQNAPIKSKILMGDEWRPTKNYKFSHLG